MNVVTEPNPNSFVWQVRVYWEDTDAGGVVYHSNYLSFFERARTEWLRARGVHQARLAEDEGVLFAIRHMAVDWHQPARLDDLLDISDADSGYGPGAGATARVDGAGCSFDTAQFVALST